MIKKKRFPNFYISLQLPTRNGSLGQYREQ